MSGIHGLMPTGRIRSILPILFFDWDEDGRPTRGKLEELALGVADELKL
jgi:hypothetical protein